MLPPLGDAAGADELVFTGEVRGNAQLRVGGEALQHVCEEGVVPVRGFDEDLGLAGGGRPLFQGTKGRGALLRLGGDVSHEGEGLAVEAGAHERHHQRGRTHQGNHFDAVPMAKRNQQRARVCHGGEAGLG